MQPAEAARQGRTARRMRESVAVLMVFQYSDVFRWYDLVLLLMGTGVRAMVFDEAVSVAHTLSQTFRPD